MKMVYLFFLLLGLGFMALLVYSGIGAVTSDTQIQRMACLTVFTIIMLIPTGVLAILYITKN